MLPARIRIGLVWRNQGVRTKVIFRKIKDMKCGINREAYCLSYRRARTDEYEGHCKKYKILSVFKYLRNLPFTKEKKMLAVGLCCHCFLKNFLQYCFLIFVLKVAGIKTYCIEAVILGRNCIKFCN